MIGVRRIRIEREIELIFPAKFKSGLADRIIQQLRAGMAQICAGVHFELITRGPKQ